MSSERGDYVESDWPTVIRPGYCSNHKIYFMYLFLLFSKISLRCYFLSVCLFQCPLTIWFLLIEAESTVTVIYLPLLTFHQSNKENSKLCLSPLFLLFPPTSLPYSSPFLRLLLQSHLPSSSFLLFFLTSPHLPFAADSYQSTNIWHFKEKLPRLSQSVLILTHLRIFHNTVIYAMNNLSKFQV